MPISLDDNKLAFQEEQANLKKIEKRIAALISGEEAELTRRQKDIVDWHAIDNEDRRNKAYLIGNQEKLRHVIDEHKSYVDSPYFGHFEMMSEAKDQCSFFVGKQGLSVGSELIILDWRSPMGNTFYKKQQSHFVVEGESYDLALRRAVDIQRAALRSVKTEFDIATLSLEGEVIDEFLISVLKDKRRNYKLTDIIRTIQENQNALIGKPVNESFIIQGCAGSGKTMILLHRLSFIAYNHPKTDFDRYYILTPNENFNVHVNELSRSLGLDRVKRYTVEAFYAELIKDRARGDNIISPRGNKPVPKLTATSIDIKSEKLLNQQMLSFIYSDRFVDSFIEDYKTASSTAVAQLDTLHTADILKKYNRSVTAFTAINYRTFSALNESINDILSKHSKAFGNLNSVENELPLAREHAAKDAEVHSSVRKA